jgi:hypothetical protein
MAVITTKSTVFATKKETTEGTLVLPAAGTDFIPPVEYPELSPNIDLLENNELRGSIGQAKSIAGPENPSASFGMYLKHSGVEGQAPNYGELMEAVFGSTSTQSTERTTTTSSTTSVVKLGAGGSDYARGKAILLKDSTNGYSIRPVHSVSSNDLTLGFNLSAAPATGMNCGKFVNYSPANASHPSVSLIRYSGNEHSIDAIAGGKVTNMSLSASAGELIEASFEMVGTKYFFDPIEITSSTEVIDFDIGGGELSASVTVKIWKTPHELAAALQAAMIAAGGTGVTVTYSNSTGKFTIAKASGTLSLLWNTGTNTASTIGTKLGFSVAADDTGSLSYVADNAQSWVAAYTVSFDSVDPLVAKSNEVFLGDSTDNVNFCAASLEISFENTNSQVKCIGAETAIESNFFSERVVTITISGRLDKHDANMINRFLNNSDTRFLFNCGEKSGGNWVAGKCASIYIPTCSVTSYNMTDLDGVVGVEIELQSFVDSSGNGEVYLNYL